MFKQQFYSGLKGFNNVLGHLIIALIIFNIIRLASFVFKGDIYEILNEVLILTVLIQTLIVRILIEKVSKAGGQNINIVHNHKDLLMYISDIMRTVDNYELRGLLKSLRR